jgi:hypothetical protein
VKKELRRVSQGGNESLELCKVMTFKLINPTSLLKPSALQQLFTDLIQFNIGIAIVTKTWFTVKHTGQLLNIEGYALLHKSKGGAAVVLVFMCVTTLLAKLLHLILTVIPILPKFYGWNVAVVK